MTEFSCFIDEGNNYMKFAIISGSTRQNNPQSVKVANYINQFVNGMNIDSHLLDLSKIVIKGWDETFWSDHAAFDPGWTKISQQLHQCDAIIIVAPEWNGMLPPALVNVMHLAVKGEFANKPMLIVSVSAGGNGVYPIVHLRESVKNSFATIIPHHVIIRDVNNVLNDYNTVSSESDRSIRERLHYSLKVLEVYAENFIKIRNSDVIKNIPYSYGM